VQGPGPPPPQVGERLSEVAWGELSRVGDVWAMARSGGLPLPAGDSTFLRLSARCDHRMRPSIPCHPRRSGPHRASTSTATSRTIAHQRNRPAPGRTTRDRESPHLASTAPGRRRRSNHPGNSQAHGPVPRSNSEERSAHTSAGCTEGASVAGPWPGCVNLSGSEQRGCLLHTVVQRSPPLDVGVLSCASPISPSSEAASPV
jgi:hypothetical protein